ncbi:MAG TPA: hypothetical protein VN836_00395 [Verrucomicrobiae bacterium]|nr:hypothetical protein [Verrucomicrobiae bacterium]
MTPWITSDKLSLANAPDVVITNSTFTYSLSAMSVVTFAGHSHPATSVSNKADDPRHP